MDKHLIFFFLDFEETKISSSLYRSLQTLNVQKRSTEDHFKIYVS